MYSLTLLQDWLETGRATSAKEISGIQEPLVDQVVPSQSLSQRSSPCQREPSPVYSPMNSLEFPESLTRLDAMAQDYDESVSYRSISTKSASSSISEVSDDSSHDSYRTSFTDLSTQGDAQGDLSHFHCTEGNCLNTFMSPMTNYTHVVSEHDTADHHHGNISPCRNAYDTSLTPQPLTLKWGSDTEIKNCEHKLDSPIKLLSHFRLVSSKADAPTPAHAANSGKRRSLGPEESTSNYGSVCFRELATDVRDLDLSQTNKLQRERSRQRLSKFT
jgi:hypothetical protein